jgi:dienelactone hydrolase
MATFGMSFMPGLKGFRRTAIAMFLGWLCALTAAKVCYAGPDAIETNEDGPAQTAYSPDSGPGPVIIVISGYSGPTSYKPYAAELAKLGYYVVLLDGKDILNRSQWPDAQNLRKAIKRATLSSQAKPGKAAVIGFSLGGGAALLHAAAMPDLVSMVVAYYPFTREWTDKINWFTKRFSVPVLVLAAQRDRYKECCLVETARAMELAAKTYNAKFELVIYPDANHGFNLKTTAPGEPNGAYRADDDRDAWRRATEMLRQYHPRR